ncbi:MAG TPA: hypothetical protein VID72_13835, partial [Ktedonobacterales bacterium]
MLAALQAVEFVLSIFELAAGWLAVLLGVAIALLVWQSGMISPGAVVVDLLGFGVILALIAVGVTLDAAVTPSRAARIAGWALLAAGTLLLLYVTA